MNTATEKIAMNVMESAKQLTISLTRKDLRQAASTMSDEEARYLVDSYYIAQRDRIRADNQVRAMSKIGEPIMILENLSRHASMREDLIKKALDEFTKYNDVGTWLRSIHGIGPVTAAGLLAHIDIRKAPTAGAIWKFSGIDGQTVWEKGQKRPWNATLRTLQYKIGESFVKTQKSDKSVYGKIFRARKDLEIQRNMKGLFAEQAAAELLRKNYKKDTPTYAALASGRLSDAHIHARARRYAVKLFLSHLHHVMYSVILKQEPPKPFAIAILGHAHYIRVPNSNLVKDFIEPVSDDIQSDPFDDTNTSMD